MDIDPRAAKLLGDLLALTLSDNAVQADSAMGAIRRRAARDGVTAGALKELVGRLQGAGDTRARAELGHMRETLDDQARALERSRKGLRLAEAALGESQQASAALALRIGQLNQLRLVAAAVAFLLGVICTVVGFALHDLARSPAAGNAGAQSLHGSERQELADFVRGCFLASSNSLGGTPTALNLVIDVDGQGRITAASLVQDQTAVVRDAGEAVYGSLALRTLNGGGCGRVPLPPSLQGKSARLYVFLPR